jgi:hypothetical protein
VKHARINRQRRKSVKPRRVLITARQSYRAFFQGSSGRTMRAPFRFCRVDKLWMANPARRRGLRLWHGACSLAACCETQTGGFAMATRASKQGKAKNQPTIRVKTTVGELLSAAFEVAGGRADRAADLIQTGPLSHLLVRRRLRFV